MGRTRLPVAGEEPLESRIATALHKIGLAMKHHAWVKANEDGLSPTQGQILAMLAEGATTASVLSQRLGVSLPTISDSVRSLVDKSLVKKSPDERHPRASVLSLTARGEEHAKRARSWPELLASAVGALSEAEKETFLRGLVKMIHSLQESGRIPTNRMCVTCTYFRPNVHDGPARHHCALVDAPLADRSLRIECADHEEASEEARRAAWESFLQAG